MFDKQGWIKKHWFQIGTEKIVQSIGAVPHHPKFKYLGWVWTPKLCLCQYACILDTSEKIKKDKRK